MAPLLKISALAFGALAGVANAVSLRMHDSTFVPDYILRVTFGQLQTACTTRPSVMVNGTSPGPTLRIPPNKATWVRVYNDMTDDNFTMHWHGISQKMAIFADGTPQAAQWPIPPQRFFDYEIYPESGDAGTYFYHSHVGFQALTAHGGLVVTDAGTPPYAYDDERMFLVGDYYNRTDANMTKGLRSPLPNYQWSGEVAAVLINGAGQAQYGANPSAAGCKPVTVIDVEPSKTYRFRAIGGTAMTFAAWAFQNHTGINVIAADGSYTKPAPVDYFQMGAGQRFDFLLKTKSWQQLQAEGNKGYYWVQIETRERPGVPVVVGYAILRYNPRVSPPARPSTPPLKLPPVNKNWLEYTLQPLSNNNFPPTSSRTRTLKITITQPVDSKQLPIFQFNGLTWNEYDTYPSPYLVDIYNKGDAAIPDFNRAQQNGGWDPQFKAFPVKVGEVLDIVIINPPPQGGAFDTHPFHLHGQHYFDIGSGRGNFSQSANDAKIANYSPVLRDSTMVYKWDEEYPGNDTVAQTGWRAWRIKVNDPGVWMMHCHILPHMIMGMQAVFVIGNASQIKAIPEPYVSGYLTYGGSAVGSRNQAPMVMHQFD